MKYFEIEIIYNGIRVMSLPTDKTKFQIFVDYYTYVESDILVYLIDENFVYHYVSQTYASLFDLQPFEMVNRTGSEIDNSYVQKVAHTLAYFRKLMQSKKLDSVHGIYVMDTVFGRKVFEYSIKYIPNLGAKVEINELKVQLVGDVIRIINQISYRHSVKSKIVLTGNHDKIPTTTSKFIGNVQLSEIEHEIMFLLVVGKSYKEISLILEKIYKEEGLTSTKIQRIIHNNLFAKFNCLSTPELISTYLQLESTHIIPERLISEDFFGIISFIGGVRQPIINV